MRISLDWINDYVEIKEPPEKLAEDLTMLGLVVESVTRDQSDTILEIEVTSNRPDCLSHIGVAREIAGLYRRPLRFPPVTDPVYLEHEEIPYTIRIKDRDLCPRYTGLVMDGIRVGPAPPWMRRRLESAGMRPVNNIVDITNYVLLEMGHPLHAFDFHLLRGGKISVARAHPGERMKTLDGVDRELDEEMLLINDARGPVAIAGVMGGLDSEISESTRTVLLECAYFNPASIRRTAKKLGLATEASYRFERGADWDDTVAATARTSQLIREIAGGRVAGSLQDVYPRKLKPIRIVLERRHAEKLLGVTLEPDFIISSLEGLAFKLVPKGKNKWLVTCPSYRSDMELEADLIEELGRFYGYQNIPSTVPATRRIGVPAGPANLEQSIRHILLGLGFSEAVNLSFAGEDELGRFSPAGLTPLTILNPLTEDTSHLRASLAPGLIRSVKRNFNHGNKDVRLFEIGKIYTQRPDGRPGEINMLGIVGSGSFSGRNWALPSGEFDYFHIKGVLNTLLRALRSLPSEVVPADGAGWLNPANASVVLAGGERLGVAGELHPDLAEEYKLKQPVYLVELDLEKLSLKVFSPVRYEPLPKYPGVERDLSVVIPANIPYRTIRTGIEGLGIEELVFMDLVDVYQGEKIPPGKVSLTLRFMFQDRRETLTIDQINAFSDNILNFLRSNFDAELR